MRWLQKLITDAPAKCRELLYQVWFLRGQPADVIRHRGGGNEGMHNPRKTLGGRSSDRRLLDSMPGDVRATPELNPDLDKLTIERTLG